MRITMLLGDEEQSRALDLASVVGIPKNVIRRELYAPHQVEISGWTARLWDHIEGALRRAYQSGLEAARPIINTFEELLIQMQTELQESAEAVRAIVVERLNTYVQATIDGALGRIQPAIVVGTEKMRIATVKVEQKIKLGGSLKLSLEGICEFVAEGELSFEAEYSAESPK